MTFFKRYVINDRCTHELPRGFSLLLFDFGEEGIAHYISNGNRDDMIKILREKADVLEQNKDIPKTIGKMQ